MVKRILENEKYLGIKPYHTLISKSDFLEALARRTDKNTYHPCAQKVQPVRKKLVCGLCRARTGQDIRKKHLRVAPYCSVSTDKDEQLSSYEAQIEYYTDKIAHEADWDHGAAVHRRRYFWRFREKRMQFIQMIRDCEK